MSISCTGTANDFREITTGSDVLISGLFSQLIQ